MSVGRKEVDAAFAEQLVGHLFGDGAHVAEHGAGGDLDEHALAHPLDEAGWVLLEDGVALGMGEDEVGAGEAQLVEGLVHVGRDGEVGQLDEEIVPGVDGEAVRVGARALDVVVAEVEVAAKAEGDSDAFAGYEGAQLVKQLVVAVWVEGVAAVGVGRGDDVGDAVLGGHADHRERGFEIGGAVVQAGQEVVVDVYHYRLKRNTRYNAEGRYSPDGLWCIIESRSHPG